MTQTDVIAEPKGDFGRVPPQDMEAEQATLGAMMLSSVVIDEIIAMKIANKDFYRPAHGVIFDAVLRLREAGEPVDPITMTDELTRAGELARIGGMSYLHDLVQKVPTTANATYYADIVWKKARWRLLIELGTSLVQAGYRQEGEIETVLEQGEVLLRAAASGNLDKDYATLGEILEAAVDDLESTDSVPGVMTGIKDLDSLTQGLQPGQLIYVGARPAVGKSVVAQTIGMNASVNDKTPTMFYSLEMSGLEIGQRAIAKQSRVSLTGLRKRDLKDDDWVRVAKGISEASDAPMYISTRPNMGINEIISDARRKVADLGVRLVIIDYIQLIEVQVARGENRQQAVSDMSRRLKLLAKELSVPIVALAQLNRGSEHREDKKPVVSDLRESGSLEQDADVVILLHREDAYEKESPRSGEIDLIVAKHRNGPTATITIGFQGHYSRVIDMAA